MGGIDTPVTMAELLRNALTRIGVLERRYVSSSPVFPSPFVVADLDALGDAADYVGGAQRHVDTLNVDFQVQDGVWVQQGVAKVASTSSRDTEYAKASAAYRIAGVEVLVTADSVTYRRVGSNWAKWRMPMKSFTPTMTGLTVGASTLAGWYSIVDGWVQGGFKITLGSGFAIATNTRMVWPEQPHATFLSASQPLGNSMVRDVSAADVYSGQMNVYPTDLLAAMPTRAVQAGAYAAANMGLTAGWTATAPVAAPATGDFYSGDFRYPIENSY